MNKKTKQLEINYLVNNYVFILVAEAIICSVLLKFGRYSGSVKLIYKQFVLDEIFTSSSQAFAY